MKTRIVVPFAAILLLAVPAAANPRPVAPVPELFPFVMSGLLLLPSFLLFAGGLGLAARLSRAYAGTVIVGSICCVVFSMAIDASLTTAVFYAIAAGPILWVLSRPFAKLSSKTGEERTLSRCQTKPSIAARFLSLVLSLAGFPGMLLVVVSAGFMISPLALLLVTCAGWAAGLGMVFSAIGFSLGKERPTWAMGLKPWRLLVVGFVLFLATTGNGYAAIYCGRHNLWPVRAFARKSFPEFQRAPTVKAFSEIRNVELAAIKILADAGTARIDGIFDCPSLVSAIGDSMGLGAVASSHEAYGIIFYELLRRGRDADFAPLVWRDPKSDMPTSLRLKPEVLNRLGGSYMDLGDDPFGHPYQLYPGPLAPSDPMYDAFRCYRGKKYVYDEATRAREESQAHDRPPADGRPGYPAPNDLPVYIYSYGRKNVPEKGLSPDQGLGGGDDINNWDKEAGWD